MFDRFASTINLGVIPDEDKIRLKGNSEIKRKVSDIIKRSRADAKNTNCYVCGKKVDSFCNSHSVPAFCLRNISDSGDVLTLNTIVDNPFLETVKGIKKQEHSKLSAVNAIVKFSLTMRIQRTIAQYPQGR